MFGDICRDTVVVDKIIFAEAPRKVMKQENSVHFSTNERQRNKTLKQENEPCAMWNRASICPMVQMNLYFWPQINLLA